MADPPSASKSAAEHLPLRELTPQSGAIGMGDPKSAAPSDQEDAPSDAGAAVILAGTARPVPGRTRDDGASVAMDALQRAAAGGRVLDPAGQCRDWLHKCFLASQLNVGARTWKHFKRVHADDIELDETQQWVRLRPSAPG